MLLVNQLVQMGFLHVLDVIIMISVKQLDRDYFIENQHTGKNPHDSLPPEKSREIIIAHAEDGAKLLEKHKMPQEIIAYSETTSWNKFIEVFCI